MSRTEKNIILTNEDPSINAVFQDLIPDAIMRPIPSIAALNAMRQDRSDSIHRATGAIIDVSEREGVEIAKNLILDPPNNHFQCLLTVDENMRRLDELEPPLTDVKVITKSLSFDDIDQLTESLTAFSKESAPHGTK